MQNTIRLTAATAALCLVSLASADDTSWIDKSNANAQVVLAAIAEFNPEAAGSFGVDGLDEEVIDLEALSPGTVLDEVVLD